MELCQNAKLPSMDDWAIGQKGTPLVAILRSINARQLQRCRGVLLAFAADDN
jgi:hypothetical protein